MHIYGDSIVPSVVSGLIVAGLALWRNNAVVTALFQAHKDQVTKDRETDLETRREEWQQLREQLNGLGSRIQETENRLVEVRTVVVGVDGRNGLKSDVRDLFGKTNSLAARVTTVESTADESRRRIEAMPISRGRN
jgi:uncharacterized protein YlxW (UPF0749 family)